MPAIVFVAMSFLPVRCTPLSAKGNSAANPDKTSNAISKTVPGLEIETVDLIELNHFMDDDGREVFRQTIFYDWSKNDRRFHVRGWRLVKEDSQLPMRRWNPSHYECRWHDNASRRQVNALQLRETWTQQDPERVNRALLPEDQRVPLFARRKEDLIR